MTTRKFQVITVAVTAAGQTVTINSNTKKEHERVQGVMFYANDPIVTAFGKMKLHIDNEEILPKEMPIFPFVASQYNSWKEIMMPVNQKASFSPVEIVYTDATPAGSFSAYSFDVILINADIVK